MFYVIEVQKLKQKENANKNKKSEHNEGKFRKDQGGYFKKILCNKQKQQAIRGA